MNEHKSLLVELAEVIDHHRQQGQEISNGTTQSSRLGHLLRCSEGQFV